MYNRLLIVVIVVPLAVILIALAVANRGVTAFTIDPFNPGNPAMTVQLPLFVFLFGALVVGLVVGAVVTWVKQGRYRKLARQRGLEAQAIRDGSTRNQVGVSPQTALPKP